MPTNSISKLYQWMLSDLEKAYYTIAGCKKFVVVRIDKLHQKYFVSIMYTI